MPKLTIYLPDEEPLKVSFDDQVEVNIGRSDDNDIVVNHDSMSSHHAQLRLVGDHYHLVDLDSTNGTFLDGAPATEEPLFNGSRITFGTVDADYVAEDEAPADGQQIDDDGFAESGGGSGFENTIHAAVATVSAAPANFKNLSPLPKVEKKDAVSQISMILGIVGIVAALAVVGFALMMKV